MKRPIIKTQTLSVYISTTLVLLLLGIMGLLFIGGQSASERIKESFKMTLVIDKEANEEAIAKLQKFVNDKEYVQESKYISKEQALIEETESLGYNPLELLGYNPYEAQIEVTLKNDYTNTDKMAEIEKDLKKNKLTSEVIYHKDNIDKVNENINKIAMMLLLLLLLLTVISWSLIGNLVRLSIYSKRFILHTMKLVGATWGFIRKPFLLNNMCIGLVSGIIANTILGTGIYMLQESSPEVASLLSMDKLAIVAAAVIMFGVTICTLCAYLSVNRFLRMRNNDLYFI
ncbi:MAG: permease-like cell division protein FtsX [Bacteroidaceae bacterium]|nr:permease-like cell division protein FtsX [Bacteroidaceae bacterium]